MHIMDSFNKTMSYLETVLTGEIDENKIFQLSGYSYAMFSRIFSILTETSLAEYIRLRRLTESAIELRQTKQKVIDLALKYGYESPDSFGAAFKCFHGHTPTEVRQGKSFQVVSRVQLSLSVKGGRRMNITVQKKSAFSVAGVKLEAIDTSLCPVVWKQLYDRFTHDELSQLGNGQSYGMCFDVENSLHINYMACYDAKNKAVAEQKGLEFMDVPENEYAVVNLQGPVPQCIHEGWKYLMEVFFPEQGYQHSGEADFEVYHEGDMDSQDYTMELWVPVKKIRQ